MKNLHEIFESHFHQKYSFTDFLTIDISNEFTRFNQSKREVVNPSEKLKAFHRFLNSYVFEYASMNTEVVFSYRKGTNTADAVKKHANSHYFFQTDIQAFFASVNKADIQETLISNLNNVPIADLEAHKPRILDLITVDNALPVGFSTSPIISNTCLFKFDNELQQHCLQHGIIYTRYSDDMILSSENKAVLINIEQTITSILDASFTGRLKLNRAKTKNMKRGSKIKLLGMVILPSGKVTVDIKVKKKIEALLHFYVNDKAKFVNYVGGNFDEGLSKISGQLNYINSIDKSYLNKLRKKYGNFVVDSFFNKSAQSL